MRRGLGGLRPRGHVVEKGWRSPDDLEEKRGFSALAQGKTRLTMPSYPLWPCPALSSPGLVAPPTTTSHQTVEAVEGLQPTDTVLPREGDGERGGLGGGGDTRGFPNLSSSALGREQALWSHLPSSGLLSL